MYFRGCTVNLILYIPIDNDIPPLEDMTEFLEKAEKVQNLSLHNGDTHKLSTDKVKPVSNSFKPPTELSSKNKETQKSPACDGNINPPSKKTETKHSETFAGMKKGFLFGGSAKKQSNKTSVVSKPTTAKKEENIPFIKKNENAGSNLAFDDVQTAMKASENLLQNKGINQMCI